MSLSLHYRRTPYFGRSAVQLQVYVPEIEHRIFVKRFPEHDAVPSMIAWGFYAICRRIERGEALHLPKTMKFTSPGTPRLVTIGVSQEDYDIFTSFYRGPRDVLFALRKGWDIMIDKIRHGA